MFALFLTFRARIGPQDLQFFLILELENGLMWREP